MVTLSVKLASAHGRAIVASFTTRQTVPASADTTSAATQAFETALIAAANAVVEWALAVQPPKR